MDEDGLSRGSTGGRRKASTHKEGFGPMKILILGAGGFIGASLTEAILEKTDWHVVGLDLHEDKLEHCLGHSRFSFTKGDMLSQHGWVQEHLKQCDVILPLVAIANPALYVQDPLRVFALDFEANLPLVRLCVEHKKRLIFPSTSEVYGMCQDSSFEEEFSNLVTGPINKQRWIYSCSKQLLDRVIYAHGVRDGLDYTLFRPFNWIGPKLDGLMDPAKGSSRALTHFLSHIFYNKKINLVDGGQQMRSFTDIEDGVSALLKIIENKKGCAHQKIFNVGNPHNNHTISHMAHLILETLKTYPEYRALAEAVVVESVSAEAFYGQHYQDTQHRVPAIEQARVHLGWVPQYSLKHSIETSLAYHLSPERRHLLPSV